MSALSRQQFADELKSKLITVVLKNSVKVKAAQRKGTLPVNHGARGNLSSRL